MSSLDLVVVKCVVHQVLQLERGLNSYVEPLLYLVTLYLGLDQSQHIRYVMQRSSHVMRSRRNHNICQLFYGSCVFYIHQLCDVLDEYQLRLLLVVEDIFLSEL